MRLLIVILEVLVPHVLLLAHCCCDSEAEGVPERVVRTLRAVRERNLEIVLGRGWCPNTGPFFATLPEILTIALGAVLVVDMCLVAAFGPNIDKDIVLFYPFESSEISTSKRDLVRYGPTGEISEARAWH